MNENRLPARVEARLRGFFSASPILTYLVITVALLSVVVVAWGLSRRIRSSSAPAPSVTPVRPTATPLATATATPQASPSSAPQPRSETPAEREELYLPYVGRVLPTPQPSATPTAGAGGPAPTPTPTPVDFAAVRQRLQAEGKDLATVKIGLHAGPGGNAQGLGEYLEALARVGVPTLIKSVDNYGICAQALRESADNITVFRMTGGDLELPNYELPAREAAEQHWQRVLDALPPEFDRRTWLEVMNEPDKGRADWLGAFATRTAELALRDGYRFAAFGWSSGEPEPEHWETPGMLAFLTLASRQPESLAVAVHEYSYTVADIANGYPNLIGRFQTLFRICDANGIARPTVLVTEWGWEAEKVPPVKRA
ncbi:MAG: hypothetical protein PVG25_10880, partial [Anaerolineae bacterium]